MKNILKDEKAFLNNTLTFILSLGIIVVLYYFLMPLLTKIVTVTLDMGAPSSTPLLFLQYAQWGFILFAAAAIIIYVAKTWKKIYDTGREEMLYR